jgi:hypothetical protein
MKPARGTVPAEGIFRRGKPFPSLSSSGVAGGAPAASPFGVLCRSSSRGRGPIGDEACQFFGKERQFRALLEIGPVMGFAQLASIFATEEPMTEPGRVFFRTRSSGHGKWIK